MDTYKFFPEKMILDALREDRIDCEDAVVCLDKIRQLPISFMMNDHGCLRPFLRLLSKELDRKWQAKLDLIKQGKGTEAGDISLKKKDLIFSVLEQIREKRLDPLQGYHLIRSVEKVPPEFFESYPYQLGCLAFLWLENLPGDDGEDEVG